MATTEIWTPASEHPALVDDPTMWPTSEPVIGLCVSGERRVVTCERIDEGEDVRWISKCSERWDLTGKVILWTPLPDGQ